VWSHDEESPADVADAPDAQQLWRLLVTVTGGRELAPSVAIDTFRRLHDAGQPEPVDSALLLCTDRRWRRTSARVLAGIVATGILDDAQQDRLAAELLWPDKVRYVHPLGWLGRTFIQFDLPSVAARAETANGPCRSEHTGDHRTLCVAAVAVLGRRAGSRPEPSNPRGRTGSCR
jgi:hypothetical protein